MRTSLFTVFLLVLGICNSLSAADLPAIESRIESDQALLRQAAAKAAAEVPALSREADWKFSSQRASSSVAKREQEVLYSVKQLETMERPDQLSSITTAKSRQFQEYKRLPGSVQGVEAASLPGTALRSVLDTAFSGPANSVALHNGEVILSTPDISAPGRGSIAFEFIRTYRSHVNYDGPLGFGWDHNHNIRIVPNADTLDKASELRLFDGIRQRVFTRSGESWVPEPGTFLNLEIDSAGNRLSVVDQQKTRFEFEPYERNWRIKRIESRMGAGQNRLEYQYDSRSGQLKSVVDPFQNEFRFSYDQNGRLKSVHGANQAIQFSYDYSGCLVSAQIPAVAIELRKTANFVALYRWQKAGDRYLIQEISNQKGKSSIRYEYSENRVVKAGVYALKESLLSARNAAGGEETQARKKEWFFAWSSNQTRVTSPAPFPESVFTFDPSRQNASLPVRQEIPARKAVWEYQFNADGLLTQAKTPDGQIQRKQYDSDNPDLALRNLVLKSWITGADTENGAIVEKGTRYEYLANAAFPTEVITYQIDRNNQQTVLAKDTYVYTEKDNLVQEALESGVRSRYWYNKYGETALEQSADGSWNVCYYGLKSPQNDDTGRFSDGSVNGAGQCVRLIEDANEQTVRKAAEELGVAELSVNSAPVHRISQYLYNARGERIGTKTGRQIQYSWVNRLGKPLFQYDNQNDLTVSAYNDQFEKTMVFRPQPSPETSWGDFLPGFPGRFYKETFVYNSFGQVVEHAPTNETFWESKRSPLWKYEHTPSGLLVSITNPEGVKRVTSYNDCGQTVSVHLENGQSKTVLSSGYRYSPGGRVLEYKNNHNETIKNDYSALGTVWKTTTPDGVETIVERNGLDQTVSESRYYQGSLLTCTETRYDEYGKPAEQTALQQYGKESRKVVMEMNRYDGKGRLSASRKAQNDSWTTYLYDGVDRLTASKDPVGNITVFCHENDKPIYRKQIIINGKSGATVSFGSLSLFDASDRAWLQVPVNAKGELIADRAVVTHTDLAGNIVFQKTVGVSETRSTYNTLGQKLTQKVVPASRTFSEKDICTEYGYDLSGSLLFQTTQNDALGVFGTKDQSQVDFVNAPQTIRRQYDELGREREIVQPDGLKIQKTYNDSSLVETIKWLGKDDKVLRSLKFRYDSMQRPVEITDELTGKPVRVLGYDPSGNLNYAKDLGSKHEIVVKRTFDSLNTQRTEDVLCDNQSLPQKEISVDFASGEQTLKWNQSDMIDPYWRNIKFTADAAGRTCALELNHRPFCRWNYQGSRFVERIIQDSRLSETREYNSLNELTQIHVSSAAENRKPEISFAYSYGKRGEVESVISEIQAQDGKRKSLVQYYQYDSFMNLIGENRDRFVSEDIQKRRRDIFIAGTDVASHFTNQMRFDQAGNVWTQFFGMNELDRIQPGAIDLKLNPSYFSPAEIIADKQAVSPDQKAALASNRCATVTQSGNGSLKSEEYEYDALGCLTGYDKTFTDNLGNSTDVRWSLQYDALGRLSSMEAKGLEGDKKDKLVANLYFSYDAFNRRIVKEVKQAEAARSTTTATLYERNRPCLILERQIDNDWNVSQQYLWGTDSQELLMTIVPENQAEGGMTSAPVRYYQHQDRGYSVVASTKVVGSQIPLVSVSSYLAFGENSATADIKTVVSSSPAQKPEACFDNRLDDSEDTEISTTEAPEQYLEIRLDKPANLNSLQIFSDGRFPQRFEIYRIPGEEKSPTESSISDWTRKAKNQGNGRYLGVKELDKPIGLTQPCTLPLGGLRSGRILLVWNKEDAPSRISIRELQVNIIPDNPGSIAFAGQWLDKETGLYYQLNRYRLPELNGKFISPDPLGFLDGINMYAYAHNNPLNWHDPDGQFAHILVGAGIGGLFSGGAAVISAWWHGADFTSWKTWAKIGVATAAGAVAGAFATAIIGLGSRAMGTIAASTIAGGVGGATHGLIQTTGLAKIDGYSWSESLQYGLDSAIEEGVAGLTTGFAAGFISQAVSSVFRSNPVNAPGSPATKSNNSGEITNNYYSRPGWRSGTRDQLWERSREASTGQVRNPLTGRFMSKNERWDIGHKPGYEYYKHQSSAIERGIDRKQFIDEYHDFRHLRPEPVRYNRSHIGEAPRNINYYQKEYGTMAL